MRLYDIYPTILHLIINKRHFYSVHIMNSQSYKETQKPFVYRGL